MSSHATTFRKLHEDGLLILPNVWDAGTARLVESVGALALATTSAGLAWSHGWADGDRLPVASLARAVEAITRIVSVPLSVDMEGGYADDPVTAGENVAAIVRAGGVGINIEDGTAPPDALCAKIEHVRRATASSGVDVFINARTDVYLRGLVPAEGRVEESLARAERYRKAGADGLFVPGVTDAQEIRALASGQPMPLNILVRPGLPGGDELRALGVRRLSAGSWLTAAAYGRVAALASAFLKDGVSAPLFEGATSYAEMNALFPDR